MAANSKTLPFDDIMIKLIALAKQPIRDSDIDDTHYHQVHAMNSIREVFRNGFLGKYSEPYLSQCLNLTIDCLQSPRYDIWVLLAMIVPLTPK